MRVVTSDSSTLTLLDRALDQTERLITAIGVDQAGLATPCSGWDVTALVQHLAGQDLHNFLLAARGETADWQAPSGELGEDWATAFPDRAAPLRAEWRGAGLERLGAIPSGGAGRLGRRAAHAIARRR